MCVFVCMFFWPLKLFNVEKPLVIFFLLRIYFAFNQNNEIGEINFETTLFSIYINKSQK